VRLDGFNVLNNLEELWGQSVAEDVVNGVPYEDYGEPIYFQNPRAVRLGLGLSF
jgi:hypothetical protein